MAERLRNHLGPIHNLYQYRENSGGLYRVDMSTVTARLELSGGGSDIEDLQGLSQAGRSASRWLEAVAIK
jgi:hypothetical protein